MQDWNWFLNASFKHNEALKAALRGEWRIKQEPWTLYSRITLPVTTLWMKQSSASLSHNSSRNSRVDLHCLLFLSHLNINYPRAGSFMFCSQLYSPCLEYYLVQRKHPANIYLLHFSECSDRKCNMPHSPHPPSQHHPLKVYQLNQWLHLFT